MATIECKKCGEWFATNASMGEWAEDHTGFQTFTCNECIADITAWGNGMLSIYPEHPEWIH